MISETVTYFSTHKSEIVRPMPLAQVLADFKNGGYSGQITHVRQVLASEGEDAYKAAKKGLPAIAFCGVFAGGHAKSNLVSYNGLLVFDIDHLSKEEMGRLRMKLAKDEHILAFWVSPSGNGYKGLIRIDYQAVPEKASLDTCYKKAFENATQYFNEMFGTQLDQNCSDYSRICYVCWDQELFVNEGAKRFDVNCSDLKEEKQKKDSKKITHSRVETTVFKPVNMPGKNTQHARDVLSAIIKYLSKRGLSITRSYDDWLRVGFAIASTFNYDLGVKYFLTLSKLDTDKYDEVACIEKLQECYMNGKGEVGLGTIVEMARNKGYKGSSEDL